LLLALINMFLQFGNSIHPSHLLYTGQVSNNILTLHVLLYSNYLLLSEIYTEFRDPKKLWFLQPSFVPVFSTGYHTAIACSDSSVVCTVDALTETFLPPTPTQHEKARGKRNAWSVVDIILLVVRLSYTCDCRLSYESVKFYGHLLKKCWLHNRVHSLALQTIFQFVPNPCIIDQLLWLANEISGSTPILV